MKHTNYVIISLIFMFIAVGCKEKRIISLEKPKAPVVYKTPVPDSDGNASNIKKIVPASAEKIEAGKIEKEHLTNRNPFKPYIMQQISSKPQDKPLGKPKIVKSPKPMPKNPSPLQKYETGKLKLVAVISGEEGSAAMVETPDGKGYTIRVGDLIGDNGGQVVRILGSKVIIEERYRDASGIVRKRESVLTMSVTEGEGLR